MSRTSSPGSPVSTVSCFHVRAPWLRTRGPKGASDIPLESGAASFVPPRPGYHWYRPTYPNSGSAMNASREVVLLMRSMMRY